MCHRNRNCTGDIPPIHYLFRLPEVSLFLWRFCSCAFPSFGKRIEFPLYFPTQWYLNRTNDIFFPYLITPDAHYISDTPIYETAPYIKLVWLIGTKPLFCSPLFIRKQACRKIACSVHELHLVWIWFMYNVSIKKPPWQVTKYASGNHSCQILNLILYRFDGDCHTHTTCVRVALQNFCI